jgi:hypothetical protein
MANLNYWAYWAGELRERQRTQDFMVSGEALRSWTGATLLRRLVGKLAATNPYLELNIHSVRTLLRRSVTAYVLDSDPDLARSMRQRVDRLLEHDPAVSHHACRELEDIRRRTGHP